MRKLDFELHELGAPSSWPATLHAAIAIVSASSAPMQIWWGPQAFVFCNEAAQLGPDAFGRRASDVYGSRWSELGAAFAEVCNKRNTVTVDGFTLSPMLSPMPGPNEVEAVICVENASYVGTDRGNQDFIALIGHELRNPLAAVSTALQAVMLRAPGRDVDLMERSLRHLTRIVDDLVEVSRLTRGKLTLQREPVELASVLDRALELVTPVLAARDCKISMPVARAGLRLIADAERLAKAIANMLTDIAMHSSPGVQITIGSERDGPRVRVAISDDSAHAAPEVVAASLESLQSRHPSAMSIELAMATALIELHGGTCEIHRAEVGHAAAVRFELPSSAEVPFGPVAPTKALSKRLLIIEDNDETARALKLALEQLGYTVAVAHDGPVALYMASTFDPDVALVDIGLPVMDGWELAKRLRERVAKHEVHFVAVTALDQQTDKERSREHGFAEHLVKPIDVATLQRAIEKLPDRS